MSTTARHQRIDDGTQPKASDKATVDAIQRILSGREWNADTLNDVADLVRLSGRSVLDTDGNPYGDRVTSVDNNGQ